MKNEIKLNRFSLMLGTLLLFSLAALPAKAQTTATPPADPDSQQQGPINQVPNLGPLNLTPEQIKQIRMINAEMKDQRQAAARRLVQAQRALGEAIDSPNQDQALIAQRSHDVAEAREALIRLRATTETRILHDVLTPEQRAKVREIREQNLAKGRANRRQGGNALKPNQGLQGGNAPLLTPAQRRALRRQQQQQQQRP
jgi:Spy/CpxP family protein refolding chaperone